jgi:segregation and condensation protein B
MHGLNTKDLIEAILFSIPEPFTASELAIRTGRPEGDVKKALDELSAEYKTRNGVITIESAGDKYAMVIRREIALPLRRYIKEAELGSYELKMLAVISRHSGITKSQMAKAMGSGVYDHIRSLVQKGFVQEVKMGRNTALKTTGKVPEKVAQAEPRAQTIADFSAEKPAEAQQKDAAMSSDATAESKQEGQQ